MFRIRYLLLTIAVIGIAYWVESKWESSRRSRLQRDEQSQIWKIAFEEFLVSQDITPRQVQTKELPEKMILEKRVRIPVEDSFTRLNLALSEFAARKKVSLSEVREDVKKKNLTMEFGPPGFVFQRVIFLKDERIPWDPVRICFLVGDTEETGIVEKFAQLNIKITFGISPGNRKFADIKAIAREFYQEYVFQCPVEYSLPGKNDPFSISSGMNEKEIRGRLNQGIKEIDDPGGMVILNRLNQNSRRVLETIGRERNLPVLGWEKIIFLQGRNAGDFATHLTDIMNDQKKTFIIIVPPVKPAVEGLESVINDLYLRGVEILFFSTFMEKTESPTK